MSIARARPNAASGTARLALTLASALWCGAPGRAQVVVAAEALSDSTTVSVLTVEPGDEIHAIFGHSAIRVHDPLNRLDRVYNYGTFEFDDGFLWKFVRGKLLYQLSVESFGEFDYKYRYLQRSIAEQTLSLEPDQARAVYGFLETNYLPENRFYLYDFFWDNCATRIRDAMEASLSGQLRFPEPDLREPATFRGLIDPYLARTPWLDLGIDLGLGMPADRTVTGKDFMFLPDFVFEEIGRARLRLPGGGTKAVVSDERMLFTASHGDDDGALPGPTTVFWLVSVAIGVLTLVDTRTGIRLRWLDVVLFTLTGLVGCTILFLWFFTDHETAARNLNLIWALPTHAFAGAWLARRRLPMLVRYYFVATAGIAVALAIGWNLLPQDLHAAVFPVALVLAARSLRVYLDRPPAPAGPR